ncbi:MAG: DUF4215 domain-containing protein [Polyangiaceae bacterium]
MKSNGQKGPVSGYTSLFLLGLVSCVNGPTESSEAKSTDEMGGGGSTTVSNQGGSAGGERPSPGPVGMEGWVDPPTPPSNDTCDKPTVLSPLVGETAQINGTMLGAVDDYETSCADGAGAEASLRDVAFELDLASACSTIVTLVGDSSFVGALSFRTQACTTDEYCMIVAPSGAFHAALEAGTYWVLLSATDTSSNDFTLSVECKAPICGDGFLNAGEGCDDGNTVGDDGCSATCALEAASATLDTCAGAASGSPIEIGMSQTLDLPGSNPPANTMGATDSGTGSCMLQPAGDIRPAPDHVYRVRPAASGTLTIRLGDDIEGIPFCGLDESVQPSFPYPTGCYDRALHVRTSCEDQATEVACSDDPLDWWRPEEVSFSVTAGTDYYVFVDGWNDDEYGVGSYILNLALSP